MVIPYSKDNKGRAISVRHSAYMRPTLNTVTLTILVTQHELDASYNSHNTGLQYGPGSSVGIATNFGLDGPGSIPGGNEIFRPSRPALGPTHPPV